MKTPWPAESDETRHLIQLLDDSFGSKHTAQVSKIDSSSFNGGAPLRDRVRNSSRSLWFKLAQIWTLSSAVWTSYEIHFALKFKSQLLHISNTIHTYPYHPIQDDKDGLPEAFAKAICLWKCRSVRKKSRANTLAVMMGEMRMQQWSICM